MGESEREGVCICMRARERETVCVRACVQEKESFFVCACEREREEDASLSKACLLEALDPLVCLLPADA
jgi:hypothetical protein